MTEHYPLTVNDPDRTARVAAALRDRFGDDRVHELAAPVSASEDFGSFGTEWGVPSVFWYVGGTDPDAYREAEQAGRVAQDIPTNHNAEVRPGHPPHARDRRAGHDDRRARRARDGLSGTGRASARRPPAFTAASRAPRRRARARSRWVGGHPGEDGHADALGRVADAAAQLAQSGLVGSRTPVT